MSGHVLCQRRHVGLCSPETACRAAVSQATIKKCGFLETIKRVSCVSISTKVSRSAIKRHLFGSSSPQLAEKESKEQNASSGAFCEFLILERSCCSKPEPTGPKCGDPVMAFQLLFKAVSIDMLSYPDRTWRNELWRNSKLSGGIRNL